MTKRPLDMTAIRLAKVLRFTPVNRLGQSALFSHAMRALALFALTGLLCLSLLLLPSASTAATPANGELIVNNAILQTTQSIPVSTSVTVTVRLRTNATINFLEYAPSVAAAPKFLVPPTYYQSGASPTTPLLPVPPPVQTGSLVPIDLSAPIPLISASLSHMGQPLFVMLTDLDQNLDPLTAETVIVTISNSLTGDKEALLLTETTPNSGIFIGYIQSTSTATVSYNGSVSVETGSSTQAAYTDKYDGSDVTSSSVLVDPYGRVFNSSTGSMINGATVELLNEDGTPAAVYGDNGQTTNIFPSSIISGGTALDSEGNSYSFGPGGYRFPFVNPGFYILRVTPPSGYSGPSTVPDVVIQTLPGSPYAISTGSRGAVFVVPIGPAIQVDIPLDPGTAPLWLTKSAGKNIVTAGEYIAYELNLANNDTFGTLVSPVIYDKLPPGLRYMKGSAKVNNTSVPDPSISSDGSSLAFTLNDILPSSAAVLRYVVAVGAGAVTGPATNSAFATTAGHLKSNTATATVQVFEPFMKSRSIIMGRVSVGTCGENDDQNKKGMPSVGIFMEDGTFVLTDNLGMFHFEAVRPGTHVVQLDLDSIPDGYRIQQCDQNSRFAGRAFSQFVDLQGGTMWRADFYLQKTESAAEQAPHANRPVEEVTTGEVALEMTSTQSDYIIDYHLQLRNSAVPIKNMQLSVSLPDGAAYIPGSSSINGAPLPDPTITPTGLGYLLGNADEKWSGDLQLRAKIDKKNSKSGELTAKAALLFDTAANIGLTTPEVTNTLSLSRDEKFLPLPIFVIRPHFPTFGAELSDEDRIELIRLISTLTGKIVERIDVTGHTDNVRIAPRSRDIYADNTALSLARAKAVGRYLTAALNLPPATLYLNGSADKEPVATNITVTGRALNRRVEVRIAAVEKNETTKLKIIKGVSGIEHTVTSSTSEKPGSQKPSAVAPQQADTGNSLPLVAAIPARTTDALVSPDVTVPQHQPIASENPPASNNVSTATEQHAELVSVLGDGVVNYRVLLKNIDNPGARITATLSIPKTLLYLAGTSTLSGKVIADPAVIMEKIIYNLDLSGTQMQFPLGLMALVDSDIPSDSMESAVKIEIFASDDSLLQTLGATARVSDDLQLLKNADTIVVPVHTSVTNLPAMMPERNGTDVYHEIATGRQPTLPAGSIPTEQEETLRVTENDGILSPADGSIIVNQINAVRIALNSSLTPQLVLDGKQIPDDRIGFSMKDSKTGKSLYTFIGVDFGSSGQHKLQLNGIDSFGISRFETKALITRSGEISTIRLVYADDNIADSRTPVRARIELFDMDGNPVRANAELSFKSGNLRPMNAAGTTINNISGGVVNVSDTGWINFQPVSASGLYKAHLTYNNATVDIETYVKPKMRDWILVGLAEGTTGYNTVSGNMENFKATGHDQNLYDKERVALYAKGTIKAEWLMTMAYDSAKKNTGVGGNALFQAIDPNSYYTIYGDGSSQMYDASSQKKLYLKIERDQFYALFGDFNTGLTVTELSRYSRSMTGIKSEYRSKDFDVTVFGSETAQSFVKDELRGDGTSGLYRLSKKGIVLNSEKITIESRDRFHSEIITNTQQLSRFIDYNIDYDSGTITFKSPVPNRDNIFNPVYIMVDYEIFNSGKESLTYGGRAAAKMLNGKAEVGGTYIHEGQVSGDNNLYGVDASVVIAPGTKARAEFATTDNNSSVKSSGNAYLAEVTHAGKKFDGSLYFKEQQSGFGLGQQNTSEAGTRKYGIATGYRLNEKVTLNSQAYRQYNLATDAVRDFIEALTSYNEKQYALRSGLRYANDTLRDGNNTTSILATVGGSWRTKDQKLTLRADHDQALFSKNINTDFPTRTIFGVDYQATKAVTLFAQEELTYGEFATTNITTAGVKSTPWTGGTLNSSVVNDNRENSERTFANVGLTQKWQINPKWAVDGEVGHSETVHKKTGYTMNANVPPASVGPDFTAVSMGANYTEKKLLWSNRVEYRNSPIDDKWGLMSGMTNEYGLNWGWTSRLQLYHTQSVGGNSSTAADLRLGLAYRPPVTKWIVLNRLDLTYSDIKSATFTTTGKRLINNLNANYKPDRKTQVSFQYGAKYVLEQIDSKDYSGYTDLIGIEGRYDITKEWDLGIRGSLLHTWKTDQYAYSVGTSVGYNVMQNAWISGGYNFAGFTDKDFSAANYTAQGPFIQYRMKFDQQSVKEGLKLMGQ